MSNPICWICSQNLVYKAYDKEKLLDLDGNKPCFECFLEDQDQEDNNEF